MSNLIVAYHLSWTFESYFHENGHLRDDFATNGLVKSTFIRNWTFGHNLSSKLDIRGSLSSILDI